MSIVPLLIFLALLLLIAFLGNASRLCRLARSGRSLPFKNVLAASACLSLLITCVWFYRTTFGADLALHGGEGMGTETALWLALVLGNGVAWLLLRLFRKLY